MSKKNRIGGWWQPPKVEEKAASSVLDKEIASTKPTKMIGGVPLAPPLPEHIPRTGFGWAGSAPKDD